MVTEDRDARWVDAALDNHLVVITSDVGALNPIAEPTKTLPQSDAGDITQVSDSESELILFDPIRTISCDAKWFRIGDL